MMDTLSRAEILLEALPYIKKYRDRTIVVKYGGAAMKTASLKKAVMKDLVLLSYIGVKVVLVHGGGPALSEMLNRLGKETEFVDGLRYTDEETASIAAMVLAGKVNKGLVSDIDAAGGKAVGLCGIDGGMLLAEKMKTPDLGFVGNIVSVDTSPIKMALEHGYIPVIATVGIGIDGALYNINADTAAGEIAGALSADKLISVSDVRGILRDKDDDDSLIVSLTIAEIRGLIESGVIAGGMIPKVRSCEEAIAQGVTDVAIIDGRQPHSILLELLSDTGIGTLIKR
jgi:acetylglutamate kinase